MRWPWTYARSHGPFSGLIYARRCETIDGIKTTILMHRVIIARMGIERPSPLHFVDHENGDSLDNRRVNDKRHQQLQWLTIPQNCAKGKKRGIVQVPKLPDSAWEVGIPF
jgi:hypothetical protein